MRIWKDRLDVLQWMNIANEIFGDSTQMVVHGISMGGATTMMVSGEEQIKVSFSASACFRLSTHGRKKG